MILLNEVEDRMKVEPAVFQVFVEALQSDSSLQPLATALLDTQREFVWLLDVHRLCYMYLG